VVHPANRGRGVAERLVEEVCRMEEKGLKVLSRAVVQFIVA
jgi:ribosomal protein S18 acetylase RimI-like enzyme